MNSTIAPCSYIFSFYIYSFISNCDFPPYRRTTGLMYFCDSSGMTLAWHIRSIRMTLWTWTPQCWTPFGNLTCSSQMKREQTFTRLRQTTNCFGYSKTEMSSTASGDLVFLLLCFRLWIWLHKAPGCAPPLSNITNPVPWFITLTNECELLLLCVVV